MSKKELDSLSTLFNKKIFRIPDYQRGYAWEKEQLMDFWDDLESIADNGAHYTGMISLNQVTESEYSNLGGGAGWIIQNEKYSAYYVVDGQQRLTTCIILLKCIIEKAKHNEIPVLNHETLEDINKKYIVEKSNGTDALRAYKFGYCDDSSFKYFKVKILDEDTGGELKEFLYTVRLNKAKSFFEEKINKKCSEIGNTKECLEELYKKLVNKLRFNIYYIENDFDVNVAFETMNNRGKELSNLEKLKNRLIYLTTIYFEDETELAKQVRKEINDAWKEVYSQLGRLEVESKYKRNIDDDYLKDHWTMYYAYSRSKSDAYVKYLFDDKFNKKKIFKENNIKQAYDEISKYVKSLEEIVPYWFYSFYPNECSSLNKEEKQWIERLNRLGIGYFRTLIVATMMNKDAKSSDKIKLYKLIEKFIFLCFRLAKYSSNTYSSQGYNLARELYKGEKTLVQIIEKINYELTEYRMPNVISKFRNYIVTDLFDGRKEGYYGWPDLEYFFFEYNNYLTNPKGYKEDSCRRVEWNDFIRNDADQISVEHIFPQTANNPYWEEQFQGYSQDEQKRFCNSLGNLLIMSKSKNSSFQNDSFEEKKRKWYGDWNKSEFEVAQNDNWGPKEIVERGFKLLNFMKERWNIDIKDDERLELLGLDFLNKKDLA